MIIYNITIKVDAAIAGEWIRWQQQEHIPEIMATNHFKEFHLSRLLNQDDSDGPTYVTQFFAETMEDYERYIKEDAPLLRDKAIARWGAGFIAYRSLLEEL